MTMSETCSLIIENLSVFHKESNILNNISLSIPNNKITVILGPSGCGKTTFLKCLNRLTDLYSDFILRGKIFIDGENILENSIDVSSIRQKMGLLLQKPYPLPMSIFDNVAYGLKIQGMKNRHLIKETVEKRLQDVALFDEVKDRLHIPASRLSIGQQQRLCLARGLAVNPRFILADEPTSALDPISSQIIENLFLTQKDNYTIIIVTHILRQAKRLADNVIFMHEGQVIEQGTSKIVFENPQAERLKKYLLAGY